MSMPIESNTVVDAAPTAGAPEPLRVRAMFDRIAGRYDLLNHVLSLQLDRWWRRRAARSATAGLAAPRILDLCTGTGDLLLAELRAAPGAFVVGADFSLEMLALARSKAPRQPLAGVDALHLPFRAASFDAVSVAFGVRNLADRARGFAEMHRVLRPGGRLVVLEFCPPPPGLFGRAFRVYSNHVLPRVAALIASSREAYRYLPDSMARFPAPTALAEELRDAGFAEVNFDSLAFGTVALHHATRG